MSAFGSNRLPILAAEIGEAHMACRRLTLDAIRHAVDAGHRLSEAKRLVPHGRWVPWLKENVPAISVRTAHRYMVAAERAGKNDTVLLFRLRDLAQPTRERVGFLDARRVLFLTPSSYPGFTFVTVVETDTWDASGFLRPARDDAIEMVVNAICGVALPTAWASTKVKPHCLNPWLAGAEQVAKPEVLAAAAEVIAHADRKLEGFGYTGPRSLWPEERP